jgi:tetratricopeptide (TPR) repeat protein
MKSFLFGLFVFFLAGTSFAQTTDEQLASHYYTNGEFEKALPYCQKAFSKSATKFNFKRLYECYMQTENEKEAEKLLKKQISLSKNDMEYPIMLGDLYESKNQLKDAQKIYESLIEDFASSTMTIQDLYMNFRNKAKYDWALKTLEKGRKTFKDAYPLHLLYADIYAIQGQKEKMVDEYLSLIEIQASYLESVKSNLARLIDFQAEESKDFELLKAKLIEKAQKKTNETIYGDFLIWLYIQRKQFNVALIQAQSLDKREKGEGKRVLFLGKECIENKVYDVARKAFQYVVQLGDDKLYFYEAEFALLNARFIEITSQRNYSKEEIETALSEYNNTLNRVGKTRNSFNLIRERAQILAFYANKASVAIEELREALKIPGLTSIQQAELKMLLADILVVSDDIWEASLLYMQIDKDFKFEIIGSEAKFKNARIFYYEGDFDFAQSQLDVLKQSTSKLIANDAMNLSVLITDNYGLDSNFVAMSKFAQADLLLEQRLYSEAFTLYDSITTLFPYHSLSDEILYRKGQAMESQGKWNEAVAFYEELLKYYENDILADDALFRMGIIYVDHLFQREKATDAFMKILMNYKGSLLGNASRNRLRALRGDSVELEEEL